MWRTVPYSNAAGRRKGFHNLLFLLGEGRKEEEEEEGEEAEGRVWEEDGEEARDGN